MVGGVQPLECRLDVVVTAKSMVLLDFFHPQGHLGGGPTRVVDLRQGPQAAICVLTVGLVLLRLQVRAVCILKRRAQGVTLGIITAGLC